MSKYIVMHNSADCIGCKACEVQCRSLHNGGPGAFFCRVLSVEQTEPKPALGFVYTSCFHCENPWCVKACPTGAMRRRDDGIVYVETSACVGCKACITACPWAAPQWNAQTGKVDKCDLCRDRIDQGLKPRLRNHLRHELSAILHAGCCQSGEAAGICRADAAQQACCALENVLFSAGPYRLAAECSG